MVASLLPAASVAALDSFLHGIDRSSPAQTMYQISRRMRRFDYGCDENVRKGIYRRFPHEVDRYVTCEDAGTFMYFAALHAGLDVSLGVMHNFRDTNQKHLEVVLRTSTKDLAFSRDYVQNYDDIAGLADYVRMVNPTEATALIANERYDVKAFFQTGQLFSRIAYLAPLKNKPEVAIPVHLQRALLSDDEGFFLRKTYHLPGIYLCTERRANVIQHYVAKGADNMKLTDPTLITHYIKRENSNRYNFADGSMTMKFRERLFKRIFDMEFACSEVQLPKTKEQIAGIIARQKYEQPLVDSNFIQGLHWHFADKVKRISKNKGYTISRYYRRMCANKIPEIVINLIGGTLIPAEATFVFNDAQVELAKKAEAELGIKDF